MEAYAVTANIGVQDFQLIIDTGSPDTWVAQEGYKLSSHEDSTRQMDNNPCHLGTLLNPKVVQFSAILDSEFEFGYESREKAWGSIGKVLVFSLGPHHFKNALLEVASELKWTGKYVESGVLGLAGPASKVINHGGIPLGNQNPDIKSEYDSLITEIFKAPLGPKVFTLALGRAETMSGIAFFGRAANLTQLNIQADKKTRVSAAVDLKGHPMIGEWLIKPTSYTFIGTQTRSADNGETRALVDSGDELIRLPRSVANIFHGLWNPPLTSLEEDDDGRFKVEPNDATPPSLVITIDGVKFMVNAQDLKLKLDENTYYSGVQISDDESPQVLGVPFLKNVIAEFDIDNKEIVFHQRLY